MKSSNICTSMPSLVSKPQQVDFAGNLLNANLFLEMSKTAQLLSNQLFQLHQNLSLSTKNLANNIDLTPISSGYNSLCVSTDNLMMTSSLAKTSSHDSLLQETLEASAKRRLFNNNNSTSSSSLSSMSSTSINKLLETSDSSSSSSSFKRFKSNDETTFSFKTPYKTNKKCPVVPRIKDSRKKAKQLTNFDSFKLRRAYSKTNSD